MLLPKEFRMEGKDVRISRSGDGVLLEPNERRKKLNLKQIRAIFAEIDRLGPFLPEGRPPQPPMPPGRVKFE